MRGIYEKDEGVYYGIPSNIAFDVGGKMVKPTKGDNAMMTNP